MICYHHDDLDGNMAACVVHQYKPKGVIDFPSSYIQMDYNSKFNKHTSNDDVIIVDISISEDTYEDLITVCKTARTVTYIDHHATTIDTFNKHKKDLQAIDNLTYFVSNKCSGTLLAYIYFTLCANNSNYLTDMRDINPEEEMYDISVNYKYAKGVGRADVTLTKENIKNPTKSTSRMGTVYINKPAIYLTDDFDRWVFDIGDHDAELFNLGFLEDCNFVISNSNGEGNYNEKLINALDANDMDDERIKEIIKNGAVVKEYITNRYSNEISNTFEWVYNNTKFLCKNATGYSNNFGNLINRYDAVILFNYNGKVSKWEYSVYASEISKFNCKEFAESLGGGGHVKASGFSTKYLIFTDMKEVDSKKNDVIFLGGTCNDSNWREEFTKYWRVLNKGSETELFDPVIKDRDWTPEDAEKENIVKDTAKLNLFVITPEMTGVYSIAEAVDCSHNGKVFLAIYDKNNTFDMSRWNFDSVGNIIKKNKGFYKKYNGLDSMEELVKDVIAFI